MHPLEVLARLTEFAGKNIAHHLSFLSEEQLEWKPSPDAKSALEICQHLVAGTLSMLPVLNGGAYMRHEGPLPHDRASCQATVIDVTRRYAAALRAVDLTISRPDVTLPFGTFPFAQVITFEAFDAIHHHGQIAYIQTLLGDLEDHFDFEG